jgi:hypothetical protein
MGSPRRDRTRGGAHRALRWSALPTELYVIAGNVTTLMASVYRYLVTRHELRLTVPGFQRERFADEMLGQD